MIQKTKIVWGEDSSEMLEMPGLLQADVGQVIWLNGEPFGGTPWKVMEKTVHVNVCKDRPSQTVILFLK
jgi:hypothetical protein